MNFFTKIYKSISDFKAYIYFRKESTGKAFLYLFLLTLTVGLLGVIRPVYEYNKVINNLVTGFEASVNDFTFQNGKLDVKSDEPIIIENEKDGVIIIDTKGKYDKSVLDKYDRGMLVLQDGWYNKRSSMQIEEFKFNQFSGVNFTKGDVKEIIPALKVLTVFMIIFMPIWFFIKNMVTALIVALFGMIICSIKRTEESYGTLYKLSLYALTLPAIVQVILTSVKVAVPHSYKLYCLLGMIYLWFAIDAIKEEKAELEM